MAGSVNAMDEAPRTTGLRACPAAGDTAGRGATRPRPRPRPPVPPRARPFDVTVTILELVLGTVGAAVASFSSLLLIVAADGCTTTAACPHSGLIALGAAVGFVSPWLLTAVAVAVSAARMMRRRLAFWVPWVAVLLWVGSLLVTLLLVGAGTRS